MTNKMVFWPVFIVYGASQSNYENDNSPPLTAFTSYDDAVAQALDWQSNGHPEWGAFSNFTVVRFDVQPNSVIGQQVCGLITGNQGKAAS